jgi:ribonuclease Y
MNPLVAALLAAAGVAVGFALGYWVISKSLKAKRLESKKKAEAALKEAEAEAERVRASAEVEAQEKARELRSKVSKELDRLRRDLTDQKKELTRKEAGLKKKESALGKKEKDLEGQEKSLGQKEQAAEAAARRADKKLKEAQSYLERLAGMSAEQAAAELEKQVVADARAAAAEQVKEVEKRTAAEAERISKTVIVTALQRYAGEYVSERTVSVVELPTDEMKGRIIGREGRNIRTLEAATGVDVIIDDTPEAVLLSCFHPVRREVARLALTRLIADGRIHPSRIEEVVARCEADVENQCKEAGEQAVFDLGLHKIHPELVRLLGTLKFRSSYAQNLLRHSVEVGFLAGLMASELGLSVKQARRAGLLHDIGKSQDQNSNGSHAAAGAALVKKHGESPKIAQAIASHHGDPEPASLLDVIVQAANTLSAKRPGARREVLESYVRRIESLEKICKEFEGVEKAFAIQAGREVRVVVQNDKVSDDETVLLSRDMATRIENEMSYPGQVRVNVLREFRYADYAK